MKENELINRYSAWLDKHHPNASWEQQTEKIQEEIEELGYELDKLLAFKSSVAGAALSEAADVVFATMGLIKKLGYNVEEVLNAKMEQLEAREVTQQ